MKRRELERDLLDLGFRLLRHGSRHDVWADSHSEVAVPRHREIHERLAQRILARARRSR